MAHSILQISHYNMLQKYDSEVRIRYARNRPYRWIAQPLTARGPITLKFVLYEKLQNISAFAIVHGTIDALWLFAPPIRSQAIKRVRTTTCTDPSMDASSFAQ